MLGNSFSHWPGFTTDGSNGFVFTCRCGWIDLGHFWASALGGQSLGPSIAFYIGYLVEIIQRYGPGPESWRESEFTIEDLPSDLLGALFGAGFKRGDSNKIVSEFCDLLEKCGAVDVPKDKEGTLWKILQQEATFLSGEAGPSAWPTGPNDPVEPWRGKAHTLLCCGDYPGDCPGCSLQYVA